MLNNIRACRQRLCSVVQTDENMRQNEIFKEIKDGDISRWSGTDGCIGISRPDEKMSTAMSEKAFVITDGLLRDP